MFRLTAKAAKYGVVFVAGAIAGAKAARFVDGFVPDDEELVGVARAPEIEEAPSETVAEEEDQEEEEEEE